uniref:ABC transporter domain-containing protein n=1 Tax=Monodelphis domestica TaxID=13616 RepID=A0A5F8GTH4_MONDO
MWIITLLEIILELLFAILLLMYRKYIPTEHVDSVSYNIQQIETLPSFFQTSTQWELIYVPSNSEVVKNITKRAQKTLGNNIKVRGFSSERAFESYVRYHNESSNVLAAVVFEHTFRHKLESLPLKVRKYHLRFSFSPRNTLVTGRLFLMPEEPEGWRTALLFPLYPLPGPRNHFASDGGNPGYISEGFLTIQRAVDKAIIEYHGKDGGKWLNDHVTVSVKRFPFPPFVSDNFLKFLDQVLPLIILLLYSLNVLMIIRVIVQEKEKQLKEYLQMMGLSNWLLWSSYFITFFFSFLITICLGNFIACHFPKSLTSFITYCLKYLYFSPSKLSANMAVATGGCIYFITYLPYLFISSRYNQMSLDQKLAACLLSNIAMTMGINMIVRFEIKGIGVHWERLTDTVSIDDDLNLGHILGMMLVDAFCYGLAGWYMEVVFPGEYGIPQPWYFFLKRSYWYGYPKPLFRSHKDSEDNSQNQYMEAEPVGLVAGVQIKNLSKVFNFSKSLFQAVKDLTLNLYEGQITVLLGHNGAGKTTTLSMLTGLYPPTSGRAYINGFDITRNMIDIRKSLGLCPQHDLLFDSLTVTEHLYFFAMLKGFPKRKLKNEINFMLHIFNLEDKRNEFSSKLSGGMKRKLSISIALIGDSKVVMLDEPTSGMDLISRRATWDLLQKQKSRRTILLTTHHMDEADLLGDRIAIMAKGGLQCCGSSLFLKKKYGAGYRLIMVKEPQCQIKKVSQLINQFVPNATLESNVGAELSFILPKEDAHKFEDLFTELENKRKSLGIASFGTSVTTMEEVFLKMSLEGEDMGIYLRDPESEEEDEIEYHTDKNDEKLPRIHHYLPVKFNTGIYLFSQQFYAMLVKRATFSWRNWKLILLQIMVLLTFTAILLRAITFYSEINDDPQLDMSLRHYGRTIVPFSISGGTELSRQLGEYMQTLLIDDRQVPQFVKGKGHIQWEDLSVFLQKKKIEFYDIKFSKILVPSLTECKITALFNNQAYHSPAAPRSAIKAARETYHKGSRGQEIAFSLFFGMAALASSFCLLTVTERIIKAKHLQFVSGVGIINFWCSAFLWDLFIFFIPCLLLLMVFKICHMDAFVEDFHFINTLLIFLVYGWSVIPLMYLMSFFFSSSATAYAKLVVFNFFSGMISFLFVYMAKSKGKGNSAFSPSPFSITYEKNFYSLIGNGIGKYIIAMAVSGLIFLLVLFLIESKSWRLKNLLDRFMFFYCYRGWHYFFSLIICGVLQIYYRKVPVLAVNNISLAIMRGECFGLLGFNGAGKSTTFKMLTGDETISSGNAYFSGVSISSQIRTRRISYCPQLDALLDYMTGRELMYMYARLWGIPENHIKHYVKNMLKALLLESNADKLIRNLSGGNKRKLSTCISLIGRPSVVFLDEPSTGMDPVARRLLWDTLVRTRESGKAIVITSHSMEECEALCTKLAIMVAGKLKCLGGPQYLKNKFGSGYTLVAKLKNNYTEDDMEQFKKFIETTFPGSILQYEHQGIIHYNIPSENFSWAKVFGILEKEKDINKLEDYTISQITLEQVFLSFAESEKTENEDDD